MSNIEEIERASSLFAALLLVDTGKDFDPKEIRMFIQSRWARIAPLAHTIHDAKDITKGSLEMAAQELRGKPVPDDVKLAAAELIKSIKDHIMHGMGEASALETIVAKALLKARSS